MKAELNMKLKSKKFVKRETEAEMEVPKKRRKNV